MEADVFWKGKCKGKSGKKTGKGATGKGKGKRARERHRNTTVDTKMKKPFRLL